jgi:antitoxin (DNA-binding transcriptional repressor) of toxin-antitoxin stability system
MKTVTAAYARAHLPELLDFASKGGRVTIERHRKPIAEIGPSPAAEKPVPKFGTGKGKVKLIDPHAFDPMTDEQVNAFIEGREW